MMFISQYYGLIMNLMSNENKTNMVQSRLADNVQLESPVEVIALGYETYSGRGDVNIVKDVSKTVTPANPVYISPIPCSM